MNENKRSLIYVSISVVVLILCGYYVYEFLVFPLKKGMKGRKVKILQEYLIANFGRGALPIFGADGKFGDETESAVIKYLGTVTKNKGEVNYKVFKDYVKTNIKPK